MQIEIACFLTTLVAATTVVEQTKLKNYSNKLELFFDVVLFRVGCDKRHGKESKVSSKRRAEKVSCCLAFCRRMHDEWFCVYAWSSFYGCHLNLRSDNDVFVECLWRDVMNLQVNYYRKWLWGCGGFFHYLFAWSPLFRNKIKLIIIRKYYRVLGFNCSCGIYIWLISLHANFSGFCSDFWEIVSNRGE